ncbi:MAG: FAD-dependent oxidoreductase [Pseudomonadota bacterium]|nr:FAD-dependent oxidoreductase [Pseudomonadota bacterium]
MNHIVIIGAGQAAAQAIVSLRQGGYEEAITLVGDEQELPYQRPPLSKKYLSGEMEAERLFFRGQEYYDNENVTLKLGCRATAVSANKKTVTLDDQSDLAFSKLIICTGSRPRQLPLPGAELKNIFDVRTIADIDAMKPAFTPGKKLIIIGGGYIGLETAAVACKMGLETTVIEAADRVLARVTDPVMSAFYQRVHAEEGVTILTGTGVAGLHGTEGTVSGVELSDGRILEADCVVVGIGIVPNTELAEAAGLDVDNGIVVNDVARTSYPDIYAAGDCTQHPNDLLGRHLRLESVQNAIEQGKAAASDILGTPVAYHQIPWFWSDQYDVKLQIVGMSGDHDKIVTRGDLNSRSFAVFYFKGDQLTAVDAVNRPGEFMVAKKLVHRAAEGDVFEPDKLADESLSAKDLMAL